jgi:hypothetical protein
MLANNSWNFGESYKTWTGPGNSSRRNACGMPFRRVLVKTRASASFTASLKDFVGPFDLFLAPRQMQQEM